MSSDSDSMSSSDSGSGSGRSRDEDSGHLTGEGGIPMEVTLKTREDPAEEIAENNLPKKAGMNGWPLTCERNIHSGKSEHH